MLENHGIVKVNNNGFQEDMLSINIVIVVKHISIFYIKTPYYLMISKTYIIIKFYAGVFSREN